MPHLFYVIPPHEVVPDRCVCFHPFQQHNCWCVDRLGARQAPLCSAEEEGETVSCTQCLQYHGDTLEAHGLARLQRALPYDSARLVNYSACYPLPLPWHAQFVPHGNSSGSSCDSVPSSHLLPSFLYFWHQTFWARRPQHNVNYSA